MKSATNYSISSDVLTTVSNQFEMVDTDKHCDNVHVKQLDW